MTNKIIVFDSYALLCFFKKETGYEQVKKILEQAEKKEIEILFSTVNLTEVYYSILREFGENRANEVLTLIDSLCITIIDVGRELSIVAARIKSIHAIALGDCFAIGLAKLNNAKVITGDPEFKKLQDEVEIIWLPPNK
ncbi:type II toxin-antitoxin system VapC family toxin [candidate division KSB1 bacterium]|nr:type II toxin-antitoxin system VapC family toxin [candidate division KSB1 bacterium]MBL7094057.1 type II toxin-antitoxin system VapC family toxin [candidate division KSB1 bacterium]